MRLADVNVLVYAAREDTAHHQASRAWLDAEIAAPEPFAFSEMVLSSVIRILTNPRIARTPSPLEEALGYCDAIRSQPGGMRVLPGERHWGIFSDLCRGAAAKGNIVPDAYLAALAIEHGCELVTTDRDFARFPGLRWRTPF